MNIDPILTSPALMDGLKPTDATLPAAGNNGVAAEAEQLKEVAKGFEAIFINQILKQMQETIKNASFDSDDSSNEQVHGLYSTFMADSISQSGGIGLWESIYEQMADAAGLNSGLQTEPGQLDQKV